MKPSIFVVWCSLLLAGCCSAPRNQSVIDYSYKHPREFKQFDFLYPISLDTYRVLWGEQEAAAMFTIEEVRRKFGDTPGINDFATQAANDEGKRRRDVIERFRELESLSADSGCIFQYKWSDGKTSEIGLLVLKAGEIVKRETWSTELLVHGGH